jgi:PAS domain S-box-containing protein
MLQKVLHTTNHRLNQAEHANQYPSEFYNTSQYGREYVIGRNCRFLQGPKTSNVSVRRLIDALAAGQEVTETILNYRRDGSPFMNLLLIAPLYDNKGGVRYFLGCQIDVSSLIEGGRGLESFADLLARDRSESRFGDSLKKDPKHMLGEFGAVLNDEEANIVKNRTRSFSEGLTRPGTAMSGSVRAPRRRLGMDDAVSDRHLWPHPSLGPSGRLPGVYQNVSNTLQHSTPSPPNQLTYFPKTVPPRPPLPLPPHNLHLSRPPDPGPATNQIPRTHRRPRTRPRRPARRSRTRHRRHSENHLAEQLIRQRRRQAPLDPLHADDGQRRESRRVDGGNGGQRGDYGAVGTKGECAGCYCRWVWEREWECGHGIAGFAKGGGESAVYGE